jgi:hypothetical protein
VLHVRKSQRPVVQERSVTATEYLYFYPTCRYPPLAWQAARARASSTHGLPAVITSLLTHQHVGLPAC